MNGAEIILKTAVMAGIEVCFTNPGTTEMPLMCAFDSTPGITPYLGLFEGCCTGAADGYGRMTDKPAMTLLHLGPGLGVPAMAVNSCEGMIVELKKALEERGPHLIDLQLG